mgnify:CR=1 FL=1
MKSDAAHKTNETLTKDVEPTIVTPVFVVTYWMIKLKER